MFVYFKMYYLAISNNGKTIMYKNKKLLKKEIYSKYIKQIIFSIQKENKIFTFFFQNDKDIWIYKTTIYRIKTNDYHYFRYNDAEYIEIIAQKYRNYLNLS